MPHVGQTGQQVEPGAMKGGPHGYQMRCGGEGTPENTTKAFIIGHLGNTMMIHQHGQVWLRSPAHLKPSLYISYQGARHDSIVPGRCECGKGELYGLQVL